ncbi:MAG: hypothetical protein V3V91_08245 [Thermoplasmata archaeon]
MSGMVGDQLVAKMWKGVYVVGSIPQFPDKRDWSEAQEAHHIRFREAVSYAKSMLRNPETRELYEAESEGKDLTPYNAAVADYLNAPKVVNVDTYDYTGAPGEEIRVKVLDDLIVTHVRVAIVVDGKILEQGEAVQDDTVDLFWIYTTTEANEHESYVIRVTATDLPGNRTVEEFET